MSLLLSVCRTAWKPLAARLRSLASLRSPSGTRCARSLLTVRSAHRSLSEGSTSLRPRTVRVLASSGTDRTASPFQPRPCLLVLPSYAGGIRRGRAFDPSRVSTAGAVGSGISDSRRRKDRSGRCRRPRPTGREPQPAERQRAGPSLAAESEDRSDPRTVEREGASSVAPAFHLQFFSHSLSIGSTSE